MTVYIEYVFIDNFVIDLLLFMTAFKITGKPVPKVRIVICSFLGAVFALLYPLITENVYFITAAKILFGLFLTFCAAKFSCIKDYVSFTAVFLGLTFLAGGTIIGVFSLFSLDYSAEYSVGLMVLPFYIALSAVKRVITYLYRRKDVSSLTTDVEILYGAKTVKLRGFFDTGNGLYYDFSPVIVVSKSAVLPLLDMELLKNVKYIPLATAAGTDKKISFKPDAVVIYSGGEKNIFNNVRVCVVDKSFTGFDAILHPALMEEKNEGEIAL